MESNNAKDGPLDPVGAPAPHRAAAPSRVIRLARGVGLMTGVLVVLLAILEGIFRLLPTPDTFPERVRRFSAGIVMEDDALGHRLAPGARVTVAGVDYRTSRLGTRGPEPSRPEARGETQLVLVLGDSVAMGWGVAEEESWAGLLQSKLRARGKDAEVVNGAILGYGAAQEAAWLEELGPALRPDIVLVGYFPNDPEAPGTGQHAVGPSWSALWRFAAPRLRSLGVLLGLLQNATEHHIELHEPGSESWERVVSSLTRIGRWCAASSCRCALVLQPDLSAHPYPLSDVHTRLTETARAAGVAALDLAPLVDDITDVRPLWLTPDDAHPNARGHALYAEAIDRWLNEKGWLRRDERK